MITTIFTLLILFQIKHFLADYILQGSYMLGKFKDTGWELPLASHVAVHGLFTIFICSLYVDLFTATLLGCADMVIHFVVDRVKAAKHLLGRWTYTQKQFWWALGADQTMHHLTHYAIIGCIVWSQM